MANNPFFNTQDLFYQYTYAPTPKESTPIINTDLGSYELQPGYNIMTRKNDDGTEDYSVVAPLNTPQSQQYSMEMFNKMAETHSENATKTNISNEKSSKEGSLTNNEKFAYEYLVKNGIPKGTSAGIVGNLYHEGLSNPTKFSKDSHGTTSYGIAQFNSNGEYPILMSWAKNKGISGNPDFTQQLDFIIDAIKSRPKLSILLNNNISPTEASFIWGSQFERFAGDNGRNGYSNRNDSHHKRRASRANKIFEMYG